jgi:AraC-like DNA-binding protein
MGVDITREDINALKEACDGAMLALDGILTNGRGEVYFLDDQVGKSTVYYFPDNFKDKLKKYLEKDMKEEMRGILAEIYQKNWDLDGTPEMYRALIDELHLAVMKTLREITKLKTTHINIEKYNGLATLREVFDYYEAALCSIADSFRTRQVQAEADFRLEDEIIQYIEKNCYDPELSLQSLSEQFNVSCKYLSLLCKKHYGMTYLQYVQNMRIHKAAQLLELHEHSLSEVATMCGYTNQLTFRRNFKSILGVNPSDYIYKE